MDFDVVSYLLGLQVGSSSGGDLSDATATRADILYPKTAYLGNGRKGVGTIQSLEATVYTPSTSNQTIPAGKYLAGDQVIEGDASLVPQNIKKDVTLFGITGLYDGTSDIDSTKPVKFIDYDGRILYTYSTAEFAALSALPPNPSQDRLIGQGWNWTLSDAKEQVASTGELIIGQTYITKSGATEIDLSLTESTLSPYFCLYGQGEVVVDWGDHSTLETITFNGPQWINHTYSTAGNYTVSITVNSGSWSIQGSSYTGQTGFISYTSSFTNSRVYGSTITAIWLGSNTTIANQGLANCQALKYLTLPLNSNIQTTALTGCYSLKSLTLPTGQTNNPMVSSCYELESISIPNGITQVSFSSCYSLELITLPDTVTSLNSYAFYYCYKLKHIVLPNAITEIPQFTFCNCYTLQSITLPEEITNISSYAFQGCHDLRILTIPALVTSLQSRSFQYCYSLAELHFLPTAPPVAAAFDVFGDLAPNCIIYVPTGTLNAYTSATNYPGSNYTYLEE